jgi:hypothetical protein
MFRINNNNSSGSWRIAVALAAVVMLIASVSAVLQQPLLQEASAKDSDFRLNQQFHFNDNNGNDQTNCFIQSTVPHTNEVSTNHKERVECG